MKKTIFALAAGLALIGGTVAQAQPELDFTVPASNPSGSISYAGGSADLVGTGISISQVEGLGTPSNNNVTEAITSGILSFTSGASTGSWTWGTGAAGSLTITGGMSTPSIPGGTQLVTGQIESVVVTASGNNFDVAIAVILNTVNSTLASYYGLTGGSGTSYSGNFNIGFHATGSPPSSFSSYQVNSGDVITSPVPEPSTMAIAGLGALGMIGYGLRRRKALGT